MPYKHDLKKCNARKESLSERDPLQAGLAWAKLKNAARKRWANISGVLRVISIVLKGVIMCLAIPVQVVECLPDNKVKARVGEGETFMEVSTLLLPEKVHEGDFLIVHAGFALHTLDPQEAEESLKLFRQIAEQDGLSVTF